MPTPTELRNQRIRKLLAWAHKQQKQQNTPFRDITPIYRQSLLLFPLVGERTATSYAKAALRILQEEERKRRKQKGEKDE